MDEHPLVTIARLTQELDGAGMELEERPFSQGARLRVWLPDQAAKRKVMAVALVAGWNTASQQHLNWATDLAYDGVQLVVDIPHSEIVAVRRLLARAQLEAGARELGNGNALIDGTRVVITDVAVEHAPQAGEPWWRVADEPLWREVES